MWRSNNIIRNIKLIGSKTRISSLFFSTNSHISSPLQSQIPILQNPNHFHFVAHSLPNSIFASSVALRYFSGNSSEYVGDNTRGGETSEEVEPIDIWEEEDEAEPEIGDGGDGGGIVLQGCSWGARALSIAQEVLPQFGDDIEMFSFKTTPRGYIYVRLDKLPNKYGCPGIEEIENYSRVYKKRLDEVGEDGGLPDDLALEVSSPGAERLLKVPDDLQRFQDMPMRVSYVEDIDARYPEKSGIFFLDTIETESGSCVWSLADVKENRDPTSKGRPLSRKQKDWRLKLPYAMFKKRYGSVFKTHILGFPTIVSMDPGLNRHILLNEGKGLVPGYPKSMLDILGKYNIASVYGSTHKYIRGSLLSVIGRAMIKDSLLPKIDKSMQIHINSWDGRIIDIQQKTKDMAFFVSFRQILDTEQSSVYSALKSEFDKLIDGSLSLPINFPGTNYYQGLKGRKKIIRNLREIIEERKASAMPLYRDQLDHLLRSMDSKFQLNNEEIIDQIITILYSGYETISTTSMMAIKYLHDHPQALQELRNEHFRIRQNKKTNEPIYWNDYKSMTFTRAVIFETSRLATVVNGVLRKATEDMEVNGLIIPKGWRVYVYTREMNYDPSLYPDPFTFNPWRWLQDKSLEFHKYCFFFGGGSRLCPGKEIGIVQVSTFLHYFVTSYR